ncbi:MAG: hypothetical protein ACYC2V_04505 [Thiobacillus sp.]
MFKDWTQGLQKKELAKLNAKLDMLEMHGADLFPNTLSGTNTAGIQKLRVHGKVQLRPLLCLGPIDVDAEFTLLMGATERDSKLVPEDADKTADAHKNSVLADSNNRRKKHERVG